MIDTLIACGLMIACLITFIWCVRMKVTDNRKDD